VDSEPNTSAQDDAELVALWDASCEAWEQAHKHGWSEPWGTRARDAQAAYVVAWDLMLALRDGDSPRPA